MASDDYEREFCWPQSRDAAMVNYSMFMTIIDIYIYDVHLYIYIYDVHTYIHIFASVPWFTTSSLFFLRRILSGLKITHP